MSPEPPHREARGTADTQMPGVLGEWEEPLFTTIHNLLIRSPSPSMQKLIAFPNGESDPVSLATYQALDRKTFISNFPTFRKGYSNLW